MIPHTLRAIPARLVIDLRILENSFFQYGFVRRK
jgi:hypothetical protein